MFSKTITFGALFALLASAGASARASYQYMRNSTLYDLVPEVNGPYFATGKVNSIEPGFEGAISEFWYL